MNVQTMNYWKDLILKAPKVEIVDDGWTLHVGGWQSRATIPLTQIDGVQGHCAAFWKKYPEEDEKLEFIFWANNVTKEVFKYEHAPDVDAFLTKLICEILPNLKLNLEGELGIVDGTDEILSKINDLFCALENPNVVADSSAIINNCVTCAEKTMTTTPCCEAHLCVRCLSKIPWTKTYRSSQKNKLTCPAGCGKNPYRSRR
jgi:hypothetical protein